MCNIFTLDTATHNSFKCLIQLYEAHIPHLLLWSGFLELLVCSLFLTCTFSRATPLIPHTKTPSQDRKFFPRDHLPSCLLLFHCFLYFHEKSSDRQNFPAAWARRCRNSRFEFEGLDFSLDTFFWIPSTTLSCWARFLLAKAGDRIFSCFICFC